MSLGPDSHSTGSDLRIREGHPFIGKGVQGRNKFGILSVQVLDDELKENVVVPRLRKVLLPVGLGLDKFPVLLIEVPWQKAVVLEPEG